MSKQLINLGNSLNQPHQSIVSGNLHERRMDGEPAVRTTKTKKGFKKNDKCKSAKRVSEKVVNTMDDIKNVDTANFDSRARFRLAPSCHHSGKLSPNCIFVIYIFTIK